MPPDDVKAEMGEHARAVAHMVREEYGHELDFSEPTIGAVESILNGFWQEGGNTNDELAKWSTLFGAYIGEMIRNCFPQATWVSGAATPLGDPYIRVDDIELYPVTWCFKRLHNGPADSVVKKYLAFREVMYSREPDA